MASNQETMNGQIDEISADSGHALAETSVIQENQLPSKSRQIAKKKKEKKKKKKKKKKLKPKEETIAPSKELVSETPTDSPSSSHYKVLTDEVRPKKSKETTVLLMEEVPESRPLSTSPDLNNPPQSDLYPADPSPRKPEEKTARKSNRSITTEQPPHQIPPLEAELTNDQLSHEDLYDFSSTGGFAIPVNTAPTAKGDHLRISEGSEFYGEMESSELHHLEISQFGKVDIKRSAQNVDGCSIYPEETNDIERNGELGSRSKFSPLSAFTVEEKDVVPSESDENLIRQQIIDQAVEAMDVEVVRKNRTLWCWLLIFLFAAVFFFILTLAITKKDKQAILVNEVPTFSPSSFPSEYRAPTLEKVLQEGVIRYGVRTEGFESDLCRAVSAAVFGDLNFAELVPVSTKDRFIALANGSIDIMAYGTTHTMSRDFKEKTTQVGFSFSVPYLYDGLAFAGISSFVECADNLNSHKIDGCDRLRICVCELCSYYDILSQNLFPDYALVPDSNQKLVDNFLDGSCNVLVGERGALMKYKMFLTNRNYTGEFTMGRNLFSKEPLALVTRGDDPEWSDIVNYVLQSLFEAERQNITQLSASFINDTTFFNKGPNRMFLNAIKAVGNFGEIYERRLQHKIPREGLDFININGDTGLIYSLPFGGIETDEATVFEHGNTFKKIFKRGKLLCGIPKDYEEYEIPFQQARAFKAFHKDFCKALAASVFSNDGADISESRLELVELFPTNQFKALSNGTVDVISGGIFSYSVDGSFSLSLPTFYSTPEVGRRSMSFGLITRQDDPHWSKLAFWVVSSTFHAEENHITKANSYLMPVVTLFGPEYKNMFRSVIQTVGNYDEIYRRNIESSFTPRSGTRNQLNSLPHGPQHMPLI